MIYIHTFSIGIDGNRREHRKIYDEFEDAAKQQRVLGGVIQAFESVENIALINDLVIDEVSCLIDDMSTPAPGSSRDLEAGSSEWDCWKVKTLNNFRNILNGDF